MSGSDNVAEDELSTPLATAETGPGGVGVRETIAAVPPSLSFVSKSVLEYAPTERLPRLNGLGSCRFWEVVLNDCGPVQ